MRSNRETSKPLHGDSRRNSIPPVRAQLARPEARMVRPEPGVPVLPQGLQAVCLRQTSIAGMLIDEYELACRMGWHAHDTLALCLVTEGTGRYVTRSGEFTHSPGEVLVEPPWIAQRHVIPYTRCLNIQIPSTMYEGLMTRDDWLGSVRCHRGGPAIAMMRRIQLELAIADSSTMLGVHGLVLQMLGFLSRSLESSKGGQPAWIKRVEEYLSANYLNAPGLDFIAAEVGLSPAHVARGFKRHTGRTLGEQARWLRVQHAIKLIQSTDLPLSQIAADMGFCDQASLTHVFRKVIGQTPSEIRRSRRKF